MKGGNPTRPGRIGKALLAVVLFLMLVAGGGYLLRDSLLLASIRLSLFDYGIAVHDIQGVRLSSYNLHISSVSFSLPGASVRSSIENLHIAFTPMLLLEGQLREINVARAILNSSASISQRNSNFSVPDTAPILASLTQFPIERITIDSLTMAPFLNEATASILRAPRALTATLDSEPAHAILRVNWHDTGFVSSYFIPENDVSSRLKAPGTATVSLQILHPAGRVLNMDVSALQTLSGVTVDLEAQASLAGLTRLARDIGAAPNAPEGLQAEIALKAQLLIPHDTREAQTFAVQMTPTQVLYPMENEMLIAAIEAFEISGQCMGSLECSLAQTLTLTAGSQSSNLLEIVAASTDDPALPAVHVDGLRVHSESDVIFGADGVRVVVHPGSVVALAALDYDAIALRNLDLQVEEAITAQWQEAGWTLASTAISLNVPEVSINDVSAGGRLILRDIDASGGFSNMTLTGLSATARLLDLRTTALPVTLRDPEVSARLALADDRLSLGGELFIAQRNILNAQLDFHLERREGTANATLPILTFTAGSGSLTGLFVTPEFAADIVAGSLEGSASLRISLDDTSRVTLEGPVTMSMGNVSGFVGETAILGLSTNAQINLQEDRTLLSDYPVIVTVASIDPGIAVEGISTSIGFDTGSNILSLTSIEASLFGGHIRSDGGEFALDNPEGTLQLQLERIDLANVLALGAYEGVAASGLVSGTLPVSLQDGALSIAGGSLYAEVPGGSIRYAGTGGASGNAALDFVNQTLGNYQYDLMETGVDYKPNGDLTLAVKLQGINPDTNPGQRINLNLNISDNIPTLLRSLQAGRSITDAVEQRMQRR